MNYFVIIFSWQRRNKILTQGWRPVRITTLFSSEKWNPWTPLLWKLISPLSTSTQPQLKPSRLNPFLPSFILFSVKMAFISLPVSLYLYRRYHWWNSGKNSETLGFLSQAAWGESGPNERLKGGFGKTEYI